MLEKIRYVNHMNESLQFGEYGLYANENDLRNFAWNITSQNNRITSFKRGIVTKTIPIVLKCESDGYAMRNKLFEVFEKDVLALKHGKLIIGEYYLRCFITEAQITDYLIDKGYMKVSLKVSTDFPYWIKERTTTFFHGQTGAGTKNYDYPHDFPMDYTSSTLGKVLNNENFVDSNFRIIIYGPCIQPIINIGGHIYSVDTTIGNNEYLTIDSTNKTIVLTKKDGSQENCFNLRNKESYIFEKIPSGSSNVETSTEFGFDVVLLEERSEPKWI